MGSCGRAACALWIGVGGATLDGGFAHAQQTDETVARAIEELRAELRERDALITELLQRVEQLERQTTTTASPSPPAPPAPRPKPAPEAVAAAQAPETTEAAETPSEPAPPQTQQTARVAPGQFEIDEDAIDRALERTLVQEGALLVPFGQAEIQPSFSYTRRVVDFPTPVEIGGQQFFGEQESRRNEFDFALDLRVGLPFDSQLELGVPYSVVDASVVNKVGGQEQNERDRTGAGVGDISVGLAKTLLREGTWWPDVVARFVWDTDSGETRDNDVVLGGGFTELIGQLSATKRQDPLAFFGSVAYADTLKNNGIEPGDQLSFTLGTVLAVSPSTSLQLFFNQQFVDNVKVDGQGIDGSDRVASTLSIGAASILGARTLLNGAVDIGLTGDAPDYAVRIALPIRFDVPRPGR